MFGDSVSYAEKMESHGEIGRVHVSESTYNKLKHKYEFESRGEVNTN